eukprot:11466972-Karenia_brevis.AAC.1
MQVKAHGVPHSLHLLSSFDSAILKRHETSACVLRCTALLDWLLNSQDAFFMVAQWLVGAEGHG